MEFRYTHNDNVYALQLEPQPDGSYRAQIGEQQYRVTAQQQPDGMLLLHINEQPLQVYYANDGQLHWVGLKDSVVKHYTLQTATATSGRARGGTASSGDITAQMPGQVIELLVAEGDVVEHGQTLMVLEAMKMEIRVSAPLAGTVTTLTVSQTDTVERGQLLVKLSPQED